MKEKSFNEQSHCHFSFPFKRLRLNIYIGNDVRTKISQAPNPGSNRYIAIHFFSFPSKIFIALSVVQQGSEALDTL